MLWLLGIERQIKNDKNKSKTQFSNETLGELKELLSATAVLLDNIISKEEIKMALDSMIESGQFSKEQIEAAKKQLNGMSQQELNAIEKKAMKMKDDPNIRRKAESLQLGK